MYEIAVLFARLTGNNQETKGLGKTRGTKSPGNRGQERPPSGNNLATPRFFTSSDVR